MKKLGLIGRALFLFVCVAVPFAVLQCGGKTANASLPREIFGISPGMSKDDAVRHLKEIGKLSREEEKRQQVWSIKDDPSFGYLAVGYDRENQVQYVTAFTKPKDGQVKRFDEIGDLTAAKKEVAGPNHRYIWEVPPQNGNSEYSVVAQGDNADHLSMLTITKPRSFEEEEEEERNER